MSAPGSRSLPSGTVTFLFTDIEGSTRLLQQLGDVYADVLAEHQRILRAAFDAHGGHEVDTQGDAFFAAFDRARGAVAAAVDAQRALAEHDWPDGAQLKVRMGVHSGDPITSEEGYTGMGVHRAARIGAVGHGGQVLISNATRELVKDDLPAGVSMKDLGRVRLKDLDHPEHVHQLVIPGVRNDFPALRVPKPPAYQRPLVLVTALVLVVMVLMAVLLLKPEPKPVTVRPNSVAAIDPKTNKITDQIPVGNGPGPMAAAAGSLWVANGDDSTISRMDLKSRQIVKSITVPGEPSALASVNGAVWVGVREPGRQQFAVQRLDPQFNHLGAATQLPSLLQGNSGSVAVSGNHLFAAPRDGLLTELDTTDGHPLRRIDQNSSVDGLAVSGSTAWLANADANSVVRLDQDTGLTTPIAVGHGAGEIAIGAGAVWLVDYLDGTVVRIDPQTNAIVDTIHVGSNPADVEVAAGSVWVTSHGDGTVLRIDPKTNKVVARIKTSGGPVGLLFADGKLWVSVGAPEVPTKTPAGGTLRMTMELGHGPVDPALAYNNLSWQIFYETCAKLLNYPDKPGAAGAQLQPEVAAAQPTVSDGGRTYTFRIREGFRFSPPSNQPVTAATFKYSLERALDPKVNGPYKFVLPDIVGAQAFTDRKAKHVSGIVARGDKLTIKVNDPAPDVLARLSMPFGCAVPIGTPLDPNGVDGIPMAGPYYVKDPGRNGPLVLVKNPNYHGTRPRNFKRIELTTDVPKAKALTQVQSGQIDYPIDGVPVDAVRRLTSSGKDPRLSINTALGVSYLLMNPTRPLFRDDALRKAINFAIDRTLLARLGATSEGLPQKPTDQYLPPGMPGFRPADIYPNKPDLATARSLAGSKHRHAVLYTCDKRNCAQVAQALKTELAAIRIDVTIKTFSANDFFARLGRPHEPYDLAVSNWLADYADPSDFIDVVIRRGTGVEPPLDDKHFNARIAKAYTLTGTRRLLAYGKLENDLARAAQPWAAFSNPVSYDYMASRIGCRVYQPAYGIDLGALCAKD